MAGLTEGSTITQDQQETLRNSIIEAFNNSLEIQLMHCTFFVAFCRMTLFSFHKSRCILFQRRFTGSCILYAQVVWDQKTIWPWSESSCDFEIYMNLAVNVIFPTLMILFILLFLSPRYDEDYVRRKRIRHLGLDMFYLNDIL